MVGKKLTDFELDGDSTQDQRRIRTLVVDDSPRARYAVSLFLQTLEDIEVVGVAEDGRQALEQVDALRPDVVLMDIQMPEMNGLEAMEYLRKRGSTARVIVITLHDSPEMQVTCRERGADGFVPKSRLIEELPSEIRRVVK
ncbi:MAG: response regulator transcription factor [Acidobacteria bacterium]|nr:response regulator transcription factor [Acidobacteriota bacterium]